MNRAIVGLALFIGVALAEVVIAGPVEDATGAYSRGDHATAFRIWSALADQGDATAQVRLGLMYARGHGVPRDDAEAVRWYRKAAEQGFAWGQTNLGYMYAQGRGIAKNYAEAVQWYLKAANQGFAMAQDNLGLVYRDGRGVTQDPAMAVDWFRKAAEQGFPQGQNNLGYMYEAGRGIAKDDAQAVEWYRKAAEQGNANAQCNLGVLYRDGRGVTQDDAAAVALFRKAAAQGYGPAQVNLAYMFETGSGTARDEREAARYYRLAFTPRPGDVPFGDRFVKGLEAYNAGQLAAAFEIWRALGEQGHSDAQYNVAVMYAKGTGVTRDPAEAARWFLMAAHKGDPDAQFELASIYESGIGLLSDTVEARRWYTNVIAAVAARGKPSPLTEQARARLAALANVRQEVTAYDGGRFVTARGTGSDCIVAIQGLITRETMRMFDDVLDKAAAQGCSSPWIMLESPGGLVTPGLAIGREVHMRKLRTTTRWSCSSACALIFVGGVERVLAGTGARIGLHQAATTRGSERWCSSTADSNSVREIRSYLRFMIPDTADDVMRTIMNTTCDEITYTQGRAAVDLGVATRLEPAAGSSDWAR